MSQPIVSINLNHGLDAMVQELGALKGQIDKALVSTSRKLLAWLNTQLMREMGREAHIKRQAMLPRFRKTIRRTENGVYAAIWIGLNPFPAHVAGKPRKIGKKGVKVHTWMFDKAFIATVNGQEMVWRRKTARRLPIMKIMISISEQMEEILPNYEGPAARKFEEIFEHELKFAMGWFK